MLALGASHCSAFDADGAVRYDVTCRTRRTGDNHALNVKHEPPLPGKARNRKAVV
jgi:hypothetical protein